MIFRGENITNDNGDHKIASISTDNDRLLERNAQLSLKVVLKKNHIFPKTAILMKKYPKISNFIDNH